MAEKITSDMADMTVEEKEAAKKEKKKEKHDQKGKSAEKVVTESQQGHAQLDTKKINTKQADDFPKWYMEVLIKGKFICKYDVYGCYIYEPSLTAMWKAVQNFLNPKIEKIGVRDCIYPMMISQANLEKEKDHIKGFVAEVAWITHGGSVPLDQKVAVRPTSETAMYPNYATQISTYRDLPYKRNQWNSVVRWEANQCLPLIRGREFPWQEGHTCFYTIAEAHEEVMQILDFYAAIYEELMAVPVVKGRKTENEKFPGAHITTTVEAFIPHNGRGIQGATSHLLGQSFAKMYNIIVTNDDGSESFVWQNSWGFSMRSLGIMIMLHGDDRGAVIPPRIADIQVALIPIGLTNKKRTEKEKKEQLDQLYAIKAKLEKVHVRIHLDNDPHRSPGYKFNEYEIMGVPLRLEFGPADLAKGEVTTSRRDRPIAEGKGTIKLSEVDTAVPALLEQIQQDMFNRAKDNYTKHCVYVTDWDQIVPVLNGKNVVLIPHCLDGDCAHDIKKLTAAMSKGLVEEGAPSMGAKALCIPFDQKDLPDGAMCLHPSCKKKAEKWVQFGRSY